VSSDSIVKGIIDDIINTAVKTAEVDEQKTKYKKKQGEYRAPDNFQVQRVITPYF
jgi:urease alpha subunit